MPDCENCNEKCPQAEIAHEIALGRMYATQELVRMVKQVESGKLVEVVRCKECTYKRITKGSMEVKSYSCNCTWSPCRGRIVEPSFFCFYGERRTE